MDADEIRALKCATYYYGAKFGDFSYFFNQIAIDETFSHIELWLRPLFQEDLSRIRGLGKTHEIRSVMENFNGEEGQLKQYDKIASGLTRLLDIDEMPPLHLVDKLPDPFSRKQWDAMSVDDKDEKKFSIAKGIYYRKDALTPCYFEFVIAHEIGHWVVSTNSEEYIPYVTLFEEGLCDFLSAFILNECSILPVEAITNLFSYNRALKPKDSLWYAYWTYCKSALNILIENGFEEITDIIRSGRENIRKIHIQSRALNNEDHYGESNIKELVCALLRADMSYTVSAKEFMVLKTTLQYVEDYIKPGRIAQDLKISADLLSPIFMNLDRLGLIVIESDDMIYQPSAILPDNIKYLNL